MKIPKINLLSPDSGRRRHRFSYWKGVLVALAALVIIVPTLVSFGSVRLIEAAAKLNPNRPEAAEKVSLLEQVRRLVGTSERRLHGEERDRINILLLGEGGEGHDGVHLTDTILFVSIKLSTGNVAVLSIPRDLWVEIPGYGLGRINNANALAEKNKPGTGGAFAAQTIAVIVGQPIDYYLRVDFSAFKTLIDDVGGVTVNVERDFTDVAYPTDDQLYQTVRFEKGWQTMNGERALIYSRSRHGGNGEGSDFARSRRQQKIMGALKDKVVSLDTLLNPSRIASIMETLQSHVITDLELWEIVKIAKIAKDVKTDEIVHHVLDDNPEGPLYATTITVANGAAYALLPRRGDWSDVHYIARDIFNPKATAYARPAEAPKPPKIEIRNGTRRPGLAQKTRELLSGVGYDVVRIGNAREQELEKTIVYDLSNGQRPQELSTLKGLLNAEVSLTVPGYLSTGLTPSSIAISNAAQDGSAPGVDFLVVIGKNASN